MIAARYSAECFAEHATREEIEAEIAYSKSLWTMKHPNPFPHSAHYSYVRELTLVGILDGTYRSMDEL
jgi:hypothetical protein